MNLEMGMYLRQELSQRLELKQRITLGLTLSQIQTFRTRGEDDTVDQRKVLKKLLEDVKCGVFSDWQNFYNRCMKRIKKKERTANVKELISSLREIIEKSQPSLEGVRIILETGAFARNYEIPKVIYCHVDALLNNTKHMSLEDRVEFIKLGGDLRKTEVDATTVYELLHRTSEDKRFVREDNFSYLFSAVSSLVQEKSSSVLRFENNYFERLMKGIENVNGELIFDGFNFVHELHDLSKEKVENEYIKDGNVLLGRSDFERLKKDYRNVPLPILANLLREGLNDALLQRVNNLFSQSYLKDKKDVRRRFFRALYELDNNDQKKEILEHLFINFSNAEHVGKILAHLEILQSSNNFVYFFDVTEGGLMIRKLSDYAINSTLKVLGLSDEYKEKIADHPERIQSGNLLTMISTYGSVLLGSYTKGISLLREITEHIIDDDFAEWRYSHEKSEEQLKCLENALNAWKANASSERLVGDLDKLQPKLNALKIAADELKCQYKSLTGNEANEENLKQINQRINEIIEVFKSGRNDIDKKSLGIEKRNLTVNYIILETILKLSQASPDNILTLGRDICEAIKATPYEDLKIAFAEAKKIVDSGDVKNLERITVVETDQLSRLFDVGRTPVQSCQRWNERTGYNQCLLAYLADSNKKLYQVLDEKGEVIIRSIVRLLPYDKESPMLMIERPYAKRWTRDYGRALFAQVAQRALEISELLNEPVAVATNDDRIAEVMEDFTKQYKKEYQSKKHRKNYSRKLPKSKNDFEYSDSFGGCLVSGQKIQRQINYILIAQE